MKRFIFALTTVALLALPVAPAIADAPYGNNDGKYNLNSTNGQKKFFYDRESGGHG
jgi:hypothetical protein